jgi:hypothetical protein
VIELEALWAKKQREVMDLAAHEIKGAMNAISVNLEVAHSRVEAARTDRDAVLPFLTAARQGLENFGPLHEATLFLNRLPRDDGADIALTLKHMGRLLVPAAKADGITLAVEGYEVSTVTGAPNVGVRLALASGLLALIKEGGGKCTLERQPETVVRFSHQSAKAVNLEPEVTTALAQHGIKARRSAQDLQIVFP